MPCIFDNSRLVQGQRSDKIQNVRGTMPVSSDNNDKAETQNQNTLFVTVKRRST